MTLLELEIGLDGVLTELFEEVLEVEFKLELRVGVPGVLSALEDVLKFALKLELRVGVVIADVAGVEVESPPEFVDVGDKLVEEDGLSETGEYVIFTSGITPAGRFASLRLRLLSTLIIVFLSNSKAVLTLRFSRFRPRRLDSPSNTLFSEVGPLPLYSLFAIVFSNPSFQYIDRLKSSERRRARFVDRYLISSKPCARRKWI